MSTTEQLARNYAAAHPTRDGGSWAGWCASLMYRFNDAEVAYDKATYAGEATEIISTDASTAPINAVHYWSGGSDNNGHCAQDLRGAGSYLFMASSHISESWGEAIGTASWSDYQTRTRGIGLSYLGWGLSYGVNPLVATDDSGTTTAGGGSTDNPIINESDDLDMDFYIRYGDPKNAKVYRTNERTHEKVYIDTNDLAILRAAYTAAGVPFPLVDTSEGAFNAWFA